jgi:hypothetical protein
VRAVSRGGCGRGRVTDEVPCTVDDTGTLGGEEGEETTRKVETTIGASRALVRNGGSGGLSVVSHGDLFEAVGTW